MAQGLLPPRPTEFEPTRATLHAYAHAVGAIPRALGEHHPKWWHVSLNVTPIGLTTDAVAIPGGGTFWLRMDLRDHAVLLEKSSGDSLRFSMTDGLTGTQFADQLIAIAADLGLQGEYAREKFESDEPRVYDPAKAEQFFDILVNVNQLFERHRSSLEGPSSPVHLWPHNFDLAFDWFGTRVEKHEEHGEVTEFPSQLNLGFYVKDAYFYSNPWPFEGAALTGVELPHGATWHTAGWEGTMLPYDALAGDPDAETKLLDYARAVHEAAAPTLMA